MLRLYIPILALLIFCGCRREAQDTADLMLPGLSLPPGSSERSRMDAPSLDSAQAAEYDIVAGRTEEAVLVIGFDCDADWAAVKAHFDAILLPMGYGNMKFPRIVKMVQESSPKLSAEEAEARARKVMQRADAVAGESAEYGAADRPYNVVLRDESKNKEILGSAGDVLSQYTLMVIRLAD